MTDELVDELVGGVDAFPKALLTHQLGALSPGRLHEICDAMAAAIEC